MNTFTLNWVKQRYAMVSNIYVIKIYLANTNMIYFIERSLPFDYWGINAGNKLFLTKQIILQATLELVAEEDFMVRQVHRYFKKERLCI